MHDASHSVFPPPFKQRLGRHLPETCSSNTQVWKRLLSSRTQWRHQQQLQQKQLLGTLPIETNRGRNLEATKGQCLASKLDLSVQKQICSLKAFCFAHCEQKTQTRSHNFSELLLEQLSPMPSKPNHIPRTEDSRLLPGIHTNLPLCTSFQTRCNEWQTLQMRMTQLVAPAPSARRSAWTSNEKKDPQEAQPSCFLPCYIRRRLLQESTLSNSFFKWPERVMCSSFLLHA